MSELRKRESGSAHKQAASPTGDVVSSKAQKEIQGQPDFDHALVLTDEQRFSNLRDEYKANIDLWIYEATFREQRNGSFLTLNTILFVALSTLITIGSSILNSAIIGILIAVFGFLTCGLWRQILERNGAYMRFRRYQLRGIEVQLQNVTTIHNQWKALNKYEPLAILGLDDTFRVDVPAKVSAIDLENRLPLLLTGLWVLIFFGGVTIVILAIVGII